MSPHTLLTGIALFFFSLSLHVFIWRLGPPRRQIVLFTLLFLSPLFLFAVVYLNLVRGEGINFFSIALLYVALSAAYLQTYPAVQALSPSLRILLFVSTAMPKGLTEEEILERFDPKQLLEDRIQDLLAAGLVREEGGKLEITPWGSSLVWPSLCLRKILALPPGQG